MNISIDNTTNPELDEDLEVCSGAGEIITRYLNSTSPQHVLRVEYSQLVVIYNVPHPSLLLHI
jgi:hypothetical protein